MFARLFCPDPRGSAHCDLPCGVYDPAQARIEASRSRHHREVRRQRRPGLPARAILIKEQRSELVKDHLWVLWTDYFKPPHFEKYPQLHSLSTRPPSWPARRHQGRLDAEGRPAARQDRRDRRDLLGDQEGLTGSSRAV